VTVEVKRLAANGTVLGTQTYSRNGRGAFQDSIEKIGGANGLNQRLRFTVTNGTGKIVVFGSRIDNRTGDPSTIEMLTAAVSGGKTTGRFEGIVLGGNGTSINGGLRLNLASSAVSDLAVLTGVPCPDDLSGVLVDVDGSNVTIDGTGVFTFTKERSYLDGTQTVFKTKWTITGTRQTDGTWNGTIRSDTTNGVNTTAFDYSKCNATNVVRNWRAGWTGN
jgi:hypothetical protein